MGDRIGPGPKSAPMLHISRRRENQEADLLNVLNQVEEGLKDIMKQLSSYNKYKQEVLFVHLDWSLVHKDPVFWRDIAKFEENDFQGDSFPCTDAWTLITTQLIRDIACAHHNTWYIFQSKSSVACHDIAQFIQQHPAGGGTVTDLKAKERVMKLTDHESSGLRKNALLCIQKLLLGAKYPSFLQA